MNVDVSRSNESSPSHHRRVNDTDTGTESAFSSATEGNARDSSAPHERLHGIARKKHRAGGADNANTTSSTSLLLQVMGVIVGMCVLAGIGVSFYLTHVQPVQSTNGGRGGGRDSGDAVSFHRHVPMHVLKKIERDRITGMEKQLQNKEPHMLNLPGEKETLGFGAALQALAVGDKMEEPGEEPPLSPQERKEEEEYLRSQKQAEDLEKQQAIEDALELEAQKKQDALDLAAQQKQDKEEADELAAQKKQEALDLALQKKEEAEEAEAQKKREELDKKVQEEEEHVDALAKLDSPEGGEGAAEGELDSPEGGEGAAEGDSSEFENMDLPTLQAHATSLVDKVRTMKYTEHVVIETDPTAKTAVAAAQNALRALMRMKYGEPPYVVEMSLRLPLHLSHTEAAPGDEEGEKVVVNFELGPIEHTPYSIWYFMENIVVPFRGGAFHRNAGHVLQAMINKRAVDYHPQYTTCAWQEYSPEFPHVQYTLGYAGRPSNNAAFYISLIDNTRNHGPASQGSASEADSVIGKIKDKESIAVVKRMSKQKGGAKGSGFISDNTKFIKILSMTHKKQE